MNSTTDSASGEQDDPGSSPSTEPEQAAQRPQHPVPATAVPDVSVAAMPGVTTPIDTDLLVDRLTAAVPLIPQPVARLSALVVGDDLMARLHEQHCGERGTTDVLTFPATTPPEPIDADIAVCADEARRQAERRGHRIEHELLLYLVHGVLHCAGLDDHDPDAARVMHEMEDHILEAVGIGTTFARPAADAARPRAALHKDRAP